MVIVDPSARNKAVADEYGIRFLQQHVTTSNMHELLAPLLSTGGQAFLVNLSVDVSSVQLIRMCRDLGALYIDTCIEPEVGGYTDPSKGLAQRTNYAMREEALALRRHVADPTAVRASSHRTLLQC